MLVPIEIKANIEGDVAAALAVLGDPTPESKRSISFVEDREGARSGLLPFLKQGIILRIRSGGAQDDSTAKLRPVEGRALPVQWSKSFKRKPLEYRIEGDWSGERRVLAASAVVEHAQDSLTAVVGTGSLDRVFTPDQRQFVSECAAVDIVSDHLVLLGPIGSTKWQNLRIGSLDDIDAERWTVAGLDFLELSIRVKRKDDESPVEYERRSERAQRSLLAAIDHVGLQVSSDPENKTKRVLEAMAGDV
jgi:hypothetical protein